MTSSLPRFSIVRQFAYDPTKAKTRICPTSLPVFVEPTWTSTLNIRHIWGMSKLCVSRLSLPNSNPSLKGGVTFFASSRLWNRKPLTYSAFCNVLRHICRRGTTNLLPKDGPASLFGPGYTSATSVLLPPSPWALSCTGLSPLTLRPVWEEEVVVRGSTLGGLRVEVEVAVDRDRMPTPRLPQF